MRNADKVQTDGCQFESSASSLVARSNGAWKNWSDALGATETFPGNAGHHLRVIRDPPSVTVMASGVEFRTGDLAEVLSGPFRRRLSVILHRYEESELWMVAIYYPSESCFVHTYLNKEQLKIIGHLEGV